MDEGSDVEYTDEQVKEILAEAAKVFLREEPRQMPRKNQLNVSMATTLSEFLNCFKLIGYDTDGNPINITVFHNVLEKNALDLLFMDQINDFVTKKR